MFEYPLGSRQLVEWGMSVCQTFCSTNSLPLPDTVVIPKAEWNVHACAYYRPGVIRLCLEDCGRPCTEAQSRNWTWPGSTVDREPYGVMAHELGHHVDWWAGSKKGTYWSDYGEGLMAESGETGISSYEHESKNPAEWFAGMLRLFVTNPDLLRMVRPKTHALLLQRWTPVIDTDWLTTLGSNCPARVITANQRKFHVDHRR